MLARFCEILSHPTRLELIKVLARQSDCICGEVIEIGSFSQATILTHLRSLKQAGFIQGEVDGPTRCYQLNSDMLETFKRLVAGL
jgi:ArsR family transcriptional regulator